MTTSTATETNAARIERLLNATDDAYSFDNYGVSGWKSCIKMLAARGYDDRQIEAILRSKWTRWAADMSNKRHGRNTGADLMRFLDGSKSFTEREVAELVRGTFPVAQLVRPVNA